MKETDQKPQRTRLVREASASSAPLSPAGENVEPVSQGAEDDAAKAQPSESGRSFLRSAIVFLGASALGGAAYAAAPLMGFSL